MTMLSLLRSLPPLLALGLLPGCHSSVRPASDPALLAKGRTLRIMALGDSITRGSGSGYGNYRRPLQALLTGGGYVYRFVGGSTEQSFNYSGSVPGQTFSPYQPNHEGYGGFRIDQIAGNSPQTDDGGVSYPGLRGVLNTDSPGIVLLMIGTNDVTQGYDPGGPGYGGGTGFAADASQRLSALVGQIYTLRPGVTIVLASLPPFSSPSSETLGSAYNAYLPGIVSRYRNQGDSVLFADMHAAFGNDAGLISSDGIHPSTAGYDRMAQTWYGALTAAPEPESWATLSTGLLGLAGLMAASKRRRAVSARPRLQGRPPRVVHRHE